MTEYAIPGEPHTTIPKAVGEEKVGLIYAVLPWTCPVCEQLVAETILEPEGMRTVVVGVESPTRQPGADQDGIPFYGPTRRVMKGKSERGHPQRLSNADWQRKRTSPAMRRAPAISQPAADHGPIEASEFDSICTNCARRLRFRLSPLL